MVGWSCEWLLRPSLLFICSVLFWLVWLGFALGLRAGDCDSFFLFPRDMIDTKIPLPFFTHAFAVF